MADNSRHRRNFLTRLTHQRRKDQVNDNTETGHFPVVKHTPKQKGRGEHLRARIASSALIMLLCALLGFGYMTQLHNTQSSYETLSESELARLLDETSTQVEKLEERKSQLTSQLASIKSAADKQKQAERVAKQNEETSGILSGRLPAAGRGVVIVVTQKSKHVDASTMFTLIEELRNAGAEVIQINTVRVVASTYIRNAGNGLESDGVRLGSPYEIRAIGNSDALRNAVQIAGGVGSELKMQLGADVQVSQHDRVRIDEIHRSQAYRYAKIVE